MDVVCNTLYYFLHENFSHYILFSCLLSRISISQLINCDIYDLITSTFQTIS